MSFDRALNVAARTLCRIGLVWQKELEPLDWVEGEAEYYLILPRNTRVVQMLSFGGLTATTRERVEARDSNWRSRRGRPDEYFGFGLDRVFIVPPPSASRESAIIPYAALAPTAESQTLNDDYAWDYERLLLVGAIAHLGGASWPEFEHLCLTARSRAVDNNHVGVPRQVRYAGY